MSLARSKLKPSSVPTACALRPTTAPHARSPQPLSPPPGPHHVGRCSSHPSLTVAAPRVGTATRSTHANCLGCCPSPPTRGSGHPPPGLAESSHRHAPQPPSRPQEHMVSLRPAPSPPGVQHPTLVNRPTEVTAPGGVQAALTSVSRNGPTEVTCNTQCYDFPNHLH
jgi:hypothetical protein